MNNEKVHGQGEISARENIRDNFNNFYLEHDYKLESGVPISATHDATVIFVGSTINVLRPYLRTGIPNTGLIINQQCLRSWNKALFYRDNVDIEYNSFFNSCATLSPPNTETKVFQEAVDFLATLPGMNKGRLVINVAAGDRALCDAVRASGIHVSDVNYDHKKPDYYRWKYGEEGLRGRGLTVAIKNDAGKYRDIGNVITVEQDDEPIAVEWGFGVETLLSRIKDTHQPLESSRISDVIPYEPGLRAKFADALMATLEMYRSGVNPGKTKQQFVLKSYLKGLSYLRRRLDIDHESMITFGHQYLGEDSLDIPENMTLWIKNHEIRIQKLQGRLALLKTVYETESARAHGFWRNDFGVDPQESELILMHMLKR